MVDDKTKTEKKRVDLGSLYPVPKTYDEIVARQEKTDLRRLAKQPKFIELQTAARLTLLFFLTLVLFNNVLNLGNAIFFTFFLTLVLSGLIWWNARIIANIIPMKNNNNPTPLFITYFACAMPLLAVGFSVYSSPLGFAGLMVANFLVVCLIMAVAYAPKLNNASKIVGLSLIWIATVALAIA